MIYFHSLSAFLHMGRYADYVWPAYGVAFLVLVLNVLIPVIRLRVLRNKIANVCKLNVKEEST